MLSREERLSSSEAFYYGYYEEFSLSNTSSLLRKVRRASLPVTAAMATTGSVVVLLWSSRKDCHEKLIHRHDELNSAPTCGCFALGALSPEEVQ